MPSPTQPQQSWIAPPPRRLPDPVPTQQILNMNSSEISPAKPTLSRQQGAREATTQGHHDAHFSPRGRTPAPSAPSSVRADSAGPDPFPPPAPAPRVPPCTRSIHARLQDHMAGTSPARTGCPRKAPRVGTLLPPLLRLCSVQACLCALRTPSAGCAWRCERLGGAPLASPCKQANADTRLWRTVPTADTLSPRAQREPAPCTRHGHGRARGDSPRCPTSSAQPKLGLMECKRSFFGPPTPVPLPVWCLLACL